MSLSLADAMTEANRLSGLIDAGIDALRVCSRDVAEKERDYRKGKSQAWVQCPDMLAKAKEAWVDAQSADLRFERDLAEGMRAAAMEAVRARRTQVSMLQSLLNAHRAEAEFVRTGPR